MLVVKDLKWKYQGHSTECINILRHSYLKRKKAWGRRKKATSAFVSNREREKPKTLSQDPREKMISSPFYKLLFPHMEMGENNYTHLDAYCGDKIRLCM